MATVGWDSCFGVPWLNISECASWVQVWTATLAIAVSGWGIWRTLKHQAAEQQKARQAQLELLEKSERQARAVAYFNAQTFAGIVSAVVEELEKLGKEHWLHRRIRIALLSDVHALMARVDQSKLTSTAVISVNALMSVAFQLRVVNDVLDQGSNDYDEQFLVSALVHCREQTDEHCRILAQESDKA